MGDQPVNARDEKRMNANQSVKIAATGFVFLTPGELRHLCPECGFEVCVRKPDLALSAGVPRSERRRAAAAVRRQVFWEGLCEHCRARWAQIIENIEAPVSDPTRSAR